MTADCRLNSSTLVLIRRATANRRIVRNKNTENELKTFSVATPTKPILLPLHPHCTHDGKSAYRGSHTKEIWNQIHSQLGYSALDDAQQNDENAGFSTIEEQGRGKSPPQVSRSHPPRDKQGDEQGQHSVELYCVCPFD